MLNLVKGEFLKLKRSSIMRISLLASTITPLMIMMVLVKFAFVDNSSVWPFQELFDQSLTYTSIMFGLLLNILIAAYLLNREYNEHTLKAILSTKITRRKFLSAKLIVFVLWSMINIILTYALVVVIGLIFHASGLTLNLLIIELAYHILVNLLLCCLTVPIVFLTLVFKNMIPSIIAGIAVSLGSFMIMGDSLSAIYPTTSLVLLTTNQIQMNNFKPEISVMIILFLFLLGLFANWIYFSRTDIPL